MIEISLLNLLTIGYLLFANGLVIGAVIISKQDRFMRDKQ